MTPQEIFKERFNSPHPITNEVLEYGAAKDPLIWELSSVELFGRTVYGVVVLDRNIKEMVWEHTDCFPSEEAARRHIESIS